MFEKMIDRLAKAAETIPVCGECGELRYELKMSGEVRPVRKMCPHQEADERHKQALDYERRMATVQVDNARSYFRHKGNPPESYEGIGLERIDSRECSARGKAVARKYVQTWPQRYSLGEGLILSGDIGTGKTMVAAALAHDIVEQGAKVMFLTVTEFQRRLKVWDTAESFLEECKDCHLLVLDDFGAERVTEWAASNLFDLVDARYQAKKPTVFTTNLGGKALADHYVRSLVNGRDKMDADQARLTVERVLSRLRQRNHTIIFTGEDQRLLAGDHGWLTEGGAA